MTKSEKMLESSQLYIQLKKIIATDLHVLILVTLLAGAFILVSPFDQTIFRIPFALIFLLFLPGYAFISALFPRNDDLDGIERFTLSIGLSIAITIFDGFALNYTPWGFRPLPIVVSLILIIFIFTIVAYFARRNVSEDVRFSVSFKDIVESVRADENEKPSDIEKALIIALVISIIIAGGMVVYAKLTFPEERFSVMYLLGSGGMAEDYVTDLYLGVPCETTVGIENHEGRSVNYILQIRLDGNVLDTMEVAIDDGATWLENVSYVPNRIGDNLKLDFLLFEDEVSAKPYRSTHLWVLSDIDYSDAGTLQDYIIKSGLFVRNWDMGQNRDWNYVENGDNFTGGYVTSHSISSDRSFEISYPSQTRSSPGFFGEIYQYITTGEDGLAVLSFDVLDSRTSNETQGYHFKQVLVDDRVVWEDDTAGDEGWQHVRVPVFLSNSSKVALRLFEKKGVGNFGINTWWDSVKIERFSVGDPFSVSVSDVDVSGPDAESSVVLRGEPFSIGAGQDVVIDGSTFGGFYYEIDDVRSYECLNLSFSGDGIVEVGGAVYTAFSRSGVFRFMGFDGHRSLDPDMADLLSEVLLDGGNCSISANKPVLPGGGYAMTYRDDDDGSSVIEFGKNDVLLKSFDVSDGGVFVYDAALNGVEAEILEFKVDSVVNGTVYLEDVCLYSNEPVMIEVGNIYGNFEVVDIAVDMIVMKNVERIMLDPGRDVAVMDGRMNLKVAKGGDVAYPYVEKEFDGSFVVRGSVHDISEGQNVVISGRNYSPFSYDLDTNNTDYGLTLLFSGDGYVSSGDAVLVKRYGGDMFEFLGYEHNISKPSSVSGSPIVEMIKPSLVLNETMELKRGYALSIADLNPATDHALLELWKDGEVVDMAIINDGTRVYEYREDDVLIFKCQVNDVFETKLLFKYVLLYAKQPVEMRVGDRYGQFKVTEITDDSIVLANFESIRFMPGEVTSLLDGAVYARTSSGGFVAYPYAIERGG